MRLQVAELNVREHHHFGGAHCETHPVCSRHSTSAPTRICWSAETSVVICCSPHARGPPLPLLEVLPQSGEGIFLVVFPVVIPCKDLLIKLQMLQLPTIAPSSLRCSLVLRPPASYTPPPGQTGSCKAPEPYLKIWAALPPHFSVWSKSLTVSIWMPELHGRTPQKKKAVAQEIVVVGRYPSWSKRKTWSRFHPSGESYCWDSWKLHGIILETPSRFPRRRCPLQAPGQV